MPGLRLWYVALLGLAGLQRLRELAISRSRAQTIAGRQAAPRSYPYMVALNVALFLVPPLEVARLRRRPAAPAVWTALVGGAAALRWWCVSTLGSAWNVRAVVPEDLQPVASGPYRWVRHPNYLAIAVEFVALPLAGGAWLSALLLSALNALALWRRIEAEERLLEAVPGYRAAFAGKARFIPGLF